MIRFAVQFPAMLADDPATDFNANRAVFIKKFKPVIFWPKFKYRFTRGIGFRKQLGKSPFFDPDEHEFAFSVSELNRKADVLINFNSYPLNLQRLVPPKGFKGLKVWHIYEFVFHAAEVNRILEANGVDYLLGYSDHGKYSSFFQQLYPNFIDKVIPFPFGTSKRFLVDLPDFETRKQKSIALGSVNLVNEPGVTPGSLNEYVDFYADKRWTHEWRRMLAENEGQLKDVMDSQLPHFPKTKNPHYDAVEMLTNYAMFNNDEGLLAFPPARSFEGPAAGCVMVSSDHPCFTDLGFEDGVNCIMHQKHNIDAFRDKVLFYQNNPERLKNISHAGCEFVRTNYTHERVADRLGSQIESLITTGKKPGLISPVQNNLR